MWNAYFWTVLLEVLVVLPAFVQHEVLDRVVATVNGGIITQSDIQTEKTMREILGKPRAKNDRELLDALIDQRLINAYIGQYAPAGLTDSEVDAQLNRVQDYRGLPKDSVRAAIRDHLRMKYFFADTFGTSFRVTDTEIRRYYDLVFVPEALARGLTPIPALSEITTEIRQNVLEEKLAADVKKWLDQARRMARIQVFDSSSF